MTKKGYGHKKGCTCPFCVHKKSKTEKKRSWCCQKCGEPIGWLGRFFQLFGLHKCRGK